jgi:hypothetical protein
MDPENLSPMGLKPQTIQPVASQYTDNVIPATGESKQEFSSVKSQTTRHEAFYQDKKQS